MSKKWWVKNNWVYSLGSAFIVLNVIYFFRLMQTGDKAIINAMINVD
jgi:hypothetical protein